MSGPLRLGLNRADGRALALAIAVELVIGSFDLLTGDDVVFVGLLAIGPFLAAAFASPARTALAGVVAVVVAASLILSQASLTDPSNVVRLVGLVLASLLALFVAGRRQSRERTVLQLRRITDGLQEALLRPVPAELGSLRCAGTYLSAATETKLGGDFHDVLQTPFGVRAVVGDVRGKGIEAIRLAASLLGRFRELALSEARLEGVAASMDGVVASLGEEEDFATVIVMEFSDDAVGIVNCGHHPPLRTTASGGVEVLEDETALGLPLGFGGPGSSSTFRFAIGERILAYTDGVVEARDRTGTFFGLPAAVARTAQLPVERAVEELVQAVHAHAGRIDDDVVLVLLERCQVGADGRISRFPPGVDADDRSGAARRP